jgi:Putative Actinobacterial Holin-X, holin superfamily III
MALGVDLRSTVDAFADLVQRHLKLLRLELARDAKAIGTEVGKIAVLSPLLLVGYGFLCVALALFLRRFMAPDLAFLLVGVLNLAIALGGIRQAALNLSGRAVLSRSLEQLERTTGVLGSGATAQNGAPKPPALPAAKGEATRG